MSQGRIGKSSASPGVTETIVWNICSYQVPVIVVTNYNTNEEHKLHKSTLQTVSRVGGYCTTNFGALCARFVDMVSLGKTQLEKWAQ